MFWTHGIFRFREIIISKFQIVLGGVKTQIWFSTVVRNYEDDYYN
jgi:hypothetical protein